MHMIPKGLDDETRGCHNNEVIWDVRLSISVSGTFTGSRTGVTLYTPIVICIEFLFVILTFFQSEKS